MNCISCKRIDILGLTLVLLVLACTTTSNHPDISNLEGCEIQAKACDVFSSVKTIALETTDSCILSNPSLVDFCDDGIFVWDKNVVYRFDGNGRFVNHIGKVGHGFGEYTGINSINYDKRRKIIYIGTFGNDVYKYGIDGKYIGKFNVSCGKDLLMTSRWSESLGLYVCETRNYRPNGLDVSLTTWTADGKKTATWPVYSDNESVDRNFTRTGSLVDTDGGMLFRLPFCDTIYRLSKDGVSEYTVVSRGARAPSRSLVEDNGNELKLEKAYYYITHWNVTPNYMYLTIACHQGYRNVLVRLSDNEIIHNQYYGYQDDDGTHQIKLKEIRGKATFWPWVSNGNKVAGLVESGNVARNPTLVIAMDKAL